MTHPFPTRRSSDLIAAAQPGMEPADLHAAFRQRREEAFRRVLASEVVDDERNVDTALPRVADGVPNAVADGVSCKDIIEEQEFASCPIDQPAQAIQLTRAGCCAAQPGPFANKTH